MPAKKPSTPTKYNVELGDSGVRIFGGIIDNDEYINNLRGACTYADNRGDAPG